MKRQTSDMQTTEGHWLESLDGRTKVAHHLRGRHNALCNDLGGIEKLSYQQRALVDRAIFLEFQLQQLEQVLVAGKGFDPGAWVQACNALSGLFSKLGLRKQAKEVPTLHQYVMACP